MARYGLPDGRFLIVEPHDTKPQGGYWSCVVSGEEGLPIVGTPLNSTIAETLGYDVAHEQWPAWIDDLAAQIEELPRPTQIRLADPVADDGFQIPSHDYRVVFWTEKPSEQMFAALEYDIVGAQDVHEVIEWAEREAGPDDCYTLFVKFESPWSDERGLLHIAGLDPSAAPEHMTFRRRHPARSEETPPADS